MITEIVSITKITAKQGYLLTNGDVSSDVIYLGRADNASSWWEIPDPDYTAEAGTYLDPIPYEVGMTVFAGLWYANEDGYIWEAIKDGIPNSFSDKEYFDIIE